MPRKKKASKKHQPTHQHKFIWITLAFLIILAAFSGKDYIPETPELHENTKLALNILSEDERQLDNDGKIMLDVKGDFPNTKEGTFEIRLKLDISQLASNYEKIPHYIVFFESRVHPTMTLRYNIYDSVIEGGLPKIKSGPLKFMDGNYHTVQYTYHQDRGQAIFFDGEKVIQSGFDPITNAITGNAIIERSNFLGYITEDFTTKTTATYIGD
ncbi:MAG: hypothetical protein O2779_04785 [Nanoarchaeota archaeon]|nr:hypothetical protein [Nanoarchaeota archaeon]